MKQKNLINIMLVTLALLLVGCAFKSPAYNPSYSNIEALKKKRAKSTKKYAVGDFTSYKPKKKSIMCRLSASVKANNGMPFHLFMREALIEDLRLSGMYSEQSNSKIKAHLKKIDFDSVSGEWVIYADVYAGKNGPFPVNIDHSYETSFAWWIACDNAAEELNVAIEKFNRAVIDQLE